MKRIFLLTVLTLMLKFSWAQSQDDLQLAYSYYNAQEYEKASYLFENVFNRTKSKTYFIYFVNCLVNTENYEKAEKAVKKQVSSSKNDLTYKILLGYVYRRQNHIDKASEQYEEVISQIKADKNQIIQCTNMFSSLGEAEWAEKTLLKGRDLTGEKFSIELFSVYAASRNQRKMVETGLDLLEDNTLDVSNVQGMFQYYVNNDINNEFYDILRFGILQRIQKTPSTPMSELLIWLFMQKKNFKSAFIQAKALDKRLGEQGQRLIILGDEALNAKDFETASECYNYVIDKGKENSYYRRAVYGVLTSMYERVVGGMITDSAEIFSLEKRYIQTFEEFGLNNQNINEVKNFSYLETYYLNSPDKAKSWVEKTLNVPSLNYSQKAQLTLTLGNIELFSGDIWGAVMRFAKVENDNKQNEYGDEAKFNKARIAYYTGNFKWAASQLDVLKAATSKLVANDAMELSLLIADNSDSSAVLEIYARGDMYFSQNQFQKAENSLDSIINGFPTSGLVDESYFLKAKISERKHDWQKAAEYYKKVADDYSFDVLADKAAYKFAEISSVRLSDKEKAKEYYMKILTDYPGSVFATESREKYRELDKR
ncbi:MAG: tetratricopeptide repeat protein [Bacteroidales bacterium]|nr:tetratricopeptide repeat protein [Bacteroidales bacterium]